MSVSAYASLTSSYALLTFSYPYPHGRNGKDTNDLVLHILEGI